MSYWYDKNIYLVGFCVLVLLFAGWAPARAQEGESADDAQEEEQAAEEDEEQISFFARTTVTATGHEAEIFRVPTPTTVIDREEIAKEIPNNAADLMRNQPGVDVNGIGPNQGRPTIRGQRGHRVLFLEDGLRLNNIRRQTDFGEITGLVEIENVQSVEVVRGAASVLWGSGAIGGVLNLVTKVPPFGADGRLGGRLMLRYSDNDEQTKGSASLSGGAEKWSWSLSGTVRDADDYEAPGDTFGEVTLENDTPVLDTAVQDESYGIYLGRRINDQSSIFLRYNAYSADATGFGLIEPALLGEPNDRVRIFYPFQDFERFVAGYRGVGLESALADIVEVKLYSSNNQRELAFDIDSMAPEPPFFTVVANIDTLNFTDIDSTGLRAELIKAVGEKQVLTYGVEWAADDSFNTDVSHTLVQLTAPFPIPGFPVTFADVTDTVPNTPNGENTSYGAFVQDEVTASDKLRLSFGVRYNDVETKATATPGQDVSGLDFSDDDIVGAVTALYSVNPNLNLLVTYGTAFRAPNIIERLFNGPTPEGFGFQITNPNLESEESENYDVGFKYLRANGYAEVVVFRNKIDNGVVQHTLTPQEFAALPQDLQDEITATGFEDVTIQQRNADRLTFEGIEAIFGYRFDNGVEVGANYTHLEGKRAGSATDPTGDSANDKYNGHLRWTQDKGRWWLSYNVRSQPSQDAPVASDTGLSLPAFTVHRLAGGLNIGRHRVTVAVDNLTDELYAEFSNASFFRPQPGRMVIVSYGIDFN
jgi:hemoglobin/transferrin/lactoferrin receptor protein